MENRRRVEEEYSKNRFYSRLDILRQKSGRAAVEDKFTSKPGSKVNYLFCSRVIVL